MHGRARLTSNSIIKGLLGQVAGLVRSIEDLVVEDREVEGKAEADGVSGGELSLGDLGGGLVGLEGLIGRVLALVANGKLSEVSVIVTLPIEVSGIELDDASEHGRRALTSCDRRL